MGSMIQIHKMRFMKNDGKDKNMLEYWNKTSKYPILSKIAFKIFTIPKSTAEVERFFSNLRCVIDDYRYNLNEETAYMLGKYCSQ